MFKTTLNKIRPHNPCVTGWTTLLKGLGKTGPDDEPLALTRILEINGLDDALWALRALEGADREIRLLAVACARQVQHLMTDPRSLSALDISERFANGQASEDELYAAWDAAWAAARAAAWAAAMAAAWDAAWAAAWAAARAAADAAANAAANAAAWAADRVEAIDVARAAARTAARAAVRAQQEQLFREFFG